MNQEPKRLYKSNKNKIFWGVIGGIGEYFNIDPTLLRLAWILVVVLTAFFPGVIAYILAAMVVPKHA
ncbi:PspC domain-containing protein [Candidatus Parcubacteria bacterium]|nr:MAG: PspC domain-containing protein [Candidatus Parcubacteria bacterium]